MTNTHEPGNAEGAGRPSGPPSGFGKDVHDYLGHYIDVADAKVSILAGFSFAVLGYLLSADVVGCGGAALRWLGIIAEAMSIGAAVYAVFPRLTSGGSSTIFWEDVLTRSGPMEYFEDIGRLDDGAVEQEYAIQNYYLSGILHRKYMAIRVGMVAFLIGAGAAALLIYMA